MNEEMQLAWLEISDMLGEPTREELDVFMRTWQRAVQATRKALAEQPAPQDSTCSNALRAQGKAYPRTCKKCGLGPCVELAQQALDKMAENARELGLDYEPAPVAKPHEQEPVYFVWLRAHCAWMHTDEESFEKISDDDRWMLYTSPPTQRTWVGLTDEEISEAYNAASRKALYGMGPTRVDVYEAIESKLKEKNT